MKSFQWRLLRDAMLAVLLTASVAVAAELPQLPGGMAAPKTPLNLPAFNLPTANGSTVRAEDYKGKVIIARFWASW